MRARFIGDPRRDGEGPSLLPFMGVTFAKGQWLGDLSDTLAAKVRANSHFEVEEQKRTLAPTPAPQLGAELTAADHRKAVIAGLNALSVVFAKNAKTEVLEGLLARQTVPAPESNQYRADLKDQLTELKVEFAAGASTEDLEAALDAATAP